MDGFNDNNEDNRQLSFWDDSKIYLLGASLNIF